MLHASTRFVLVAGATVATCAIWHWLDFAPAVWSALIWAGVVAVFYFCSSALRTRKILACVQAILIAIAFAEGILWTIVTISEHRMEVRAGAGLLGSDVLKQRDQFYLKEGPLGLQAPPGGSIEDKTMIGREVVFDVRYDINSAGLRVSLPTGADIVGCVMFFGDSYMFGWGVSDRDTTPYQLGLQSGGTFRVFNFAFPGYGAHQALAQIQDGTVIKDAKCDKRKPIYAIDEVLADDVIRATGSYFHTPRYILTAEGNLARRGTLGVGEYIDNDTVYISPLAFSVLRKVQLYEFTVGEGRRPNAFDTKRLVAIIVESRKALRRQFPNVKFMVPVWDNFYFPVNTAMVAERRKLVAALKRQGIDARGIDAILPNYRSDPLQYCIPHEYHPNAEGHRLFASYLLDHFIKGSEEERASLLSGNSVTHQR